MNIKIPVSWLRDYIKTDAATKTIAAYLTASGPSIERFKKTGGDISWDIEVTSNRIDAYSVYGIAREASAILRSNGHKTKLLDLEGLTTSLEPDISSKVTLTTNITNYKLCPRFTAIVLQVNIHESPAFIKNRLKACGIRPINNIVDITNYIMLETGQPMHAFDYDKINGAKMLLRASRDGEKLVTLDGVKRNLPTDTIVIEDSKHLIDLCGIMGAQNSQITNRTKRVVFFVQAYDAITIRKTTQALAFRTDASARFEKGVDQENILPSIRRAVFLAKQTAGANIISELIDIYPKKQKAPTINLNFEKLDKYLGISISNEKAIAILNSLGFGTSSTTNILTAKVPSWRANDIETDVDLIEEIARIYGYHNLPSKLPQGEIPRRANSILKEIITLKHALKNLGLTEAITYSIISKNMLAASSVSENEAVELANPLTDQWQFMRPTIIPSLLDVIAQNKYLEDKINIFEIAKTYLTAKTSAKAGEQQKKDIPVQDLKIAFALQDSNFAEIKGLVENLFELINRKPKFEKLTAENSILDNPQSANVKIGENYVGSLGMVSTNLAHHFGLDPNVAIAELNLTDIFSNPKIIKSYQPIPKFPPLKEDLSAIYSVNTPVALIISEVKKASELVKNVEIIDIFEDPKIGEGKKSITLRLSYQKPTTTPTQEEVNTEREKIIKSLETNLRAKVRK